MSRPSAPDPVKLGPPSSGGASCDFCDEELADHCVRLFQDYEGGEMGFDAGPWDFDLCETCYQRELKVARTPRGDETEAPRE